MARTVELLSRCGLVESTLGEWGRAASIYTPTTAFLRLAERSGVSAASIVENIADERLVRLRQSNADGPEIQFEGDDETEMWTKQLEAFNSFAGQHDLTVDLGAQEVKDWVRKLNGDFSAGVPLRKPELFRKGLYRTFNNNSFEQGGRLYGAWWINAPRSIRPSIKINGEGTVEYDYSGCAIRMLYHEKSIDYQGDPYRLDPLWEYASEEGLEEDHFRPAVKALMQALINSPKEVDPARARLGGVSVKPFSRREAIEMIEVKHSEISETFGSGAGLRLQKTEADLALSIISNLMSRGILALPVHDSFRVAQSYEKRIN